MDNLKSLFDKKQYDLIIKCSENSTDDTTLFYRISAFMSLGKLDEAIKCIDNNQKILEARLPWLMRLHIELLCLSKRFDDAYDKVKYYENLPYFSQEAEEVLKELPNIVRKMEREALAFGGASDDDLRDNLRSKDENVVVASLDALRDKDINSYLDEVCNILVNFPKQLIRSFALLLLVQKGLNKLVKFKHVDSIIEVNPSKLNPPFVGEQFNNLVKKMGNTYKDPSISENAIRLLSSYLIYIYPDNLDYSDDNLLEALYLLSASYLQIDVGDTDEHILSKNLDINKVKSYMDNIRFANEDN